MGDSTGTQDKRVQHADKKELKQIEEEWQRDSADLFDEYQEVAVLFAAATWFAPVFPLGMPLALFHAITESVSDRFKLCTGIRRVVPQSSDLVVLETWLTLFEAISYIGVVVSMAVIAVQGTWDVWHVVAIEHVLLFVKLYLNLSIP